MATLMAAVQRSDASDAGDAGIDSKRRGSCIKQHFLPSSALLYHCGHCPVQLPRAGRRRWASVGGRWRPTSTANRRSFISSHSSVFQFFFYSIRFMIHSIHFDSIRLDPPLLTPLTPQQRPLPAPPPSFPSVILSCSPIVPASCFVLSVF